MVDWGTDPKELFEFMNATRPAAFGFPRKVFVSIFIISNALKDDRFEFLLKLSEKLIEGGWAFM